MFDKSKKSSRAPKLALKLRKTGMEQRVAPTIAGTSGGNGHTSNGTTTIR